MSVKSPLFQSAMELVGHSITHYNASREIDRKLVILHLANAVELVLKDMVLDLGISIYKNPKETISIHGCISELDSNNVDLPFRNKIELLIEERNTLQHRFGSPNELTKIFYMDTAMAFLDAIIKSHYSDDLDRLLPNYLSESEFTAYKLGQPRNVKELEKLSDLANIHPLAALLAGWNYLDKITVTFLDEVGLKDKYSYKEHYWVFEDSTSMYLYLNADYGSDISSQFREIKSIKNMYLGTSKEPDKDDVVLTIRTIDALEKYLDGLDRKSIKAKALKEKEDAKRRKSEEEKSSESDT